MEGLEPPYLTASDPKSDVSTNFTTSGVEIPKDKYQIPILSCPLEFVIYNLLFHFGAANVADFTQKKRPFLSKFAIHGYPCASTEI